jgi:hypothetical protein
VNVFVDFILIARKDWKLKKMELEIEKKKTLTKKQKKHYYKEYLKNQNK